jgi:hypothetical protein
MRALLAILLLLVPATAHAQAGGQLSSFLPFGALSITGSATGTTAATTATIPATSASQTWICGFTIASTATAASMGTATSPAVAVTTRTFNPCVTSAAGQTSMSVTSAAPGAGGTVSVTAWGYFEGSPPANSGSASFAIGIGAIGVNQIG